MHIANLGILILTGLTGIVEMHTKEVTTIRPIGSKYNKTRQHLWVCMENLKKTCANHSLIMCYNDVAQMENHFSKIPVEMQEQFGQKLHEFNVRKICSDIKKVSTNTSATDESVNELFVSLSSHVTAIIDSLEQTPSKSPSFEMPPDMIGNLFVAVLVIAIVIVIYKICCPCIKETFNKCLGRNTSSEQNNVDGSQDEDNATQDDKL